MYFGAIPSDLADEIFDRTGIRVEGYNCSISAYEVRKILKDHGDKSKEAFRGQRAITEDDFVNIPSVIQSPLDISKSSSMYNGKPAIIFKGNSNGQMTVVAVVSDKRLDLFVQTAYVGIKNRNLATPIGEQAPINTPEANNGTVSKNSIRQNEAESQQISEKNNKKSVIDGLGKVQYQLRIEDKNRLDILDKQETRLTADLKTLEKAYAEAIRAEYERSIKPGEETSRRAAEINRKAAKRKPTEQKREPPAVVLFFICSVRECS